MLREIEISNYAIIDGLKIDFTGQLNIITGETGAGKSILLGALGLILGNRADSKVLFDLEKKCIVEATFDIGKYQLKKFFNENDLDYDDQLIIRREIATNGKSRTFINDTPTSLQILQKIAGQLVDLHRQFDTQDIADRHFQIQVLDAISGNQKLSTEYQAFFLSYRNKRKELDQLIEINKKQTEELELIQHQFDELEALNLSEVDQESLENELSTLNNAEEILKTLNFTVQGFQNDEQGILTRISDLVRELRTISNFNSSIADLEERINGGLEELKDITVELESVADATEYNPEKIELLNQQLNDIYKLQHKYNVKTVEELQTIQDKFENQLLQISDQKSLILQLQTEIEDLDKKLSGLADRISANRKKGAKSLSSSVEKVLKQLSMPFAQLGIQIDQAQEFNEYGKDDVEYLFSSNKGSRLQSIKKVASGGEMSRLALAIKSQVAGAFSLPTLVFDELDTGVSGEVAKEMGEILYSLSSEHQIIIITHSPLIAVKGNNHYKISKEVNDSRTFTKVDKLSDKERLMEIAVMLGGNPPSDSAIDNAKALLAGS